MNFQLFKYKKIDYSKSNSYKTYLTKNLFIIWNTFPTEADIALPQIWPNIPFRTHLGTITGQDEAQLFLPSWSIVSFADEHARTSNRYDLYHLSEYVIHF